ncbi:MAG: 1-aminocyclopropane-1-carboxylate deaminase [Legionellales bacterium]
MDANPDTLIEPRSTHWNLSSRVHKLNQFPNQGVACYVKREDELSCGISGSKLRKYSSLMPALVNRGIKHLIIIAGPQSNNLLAALQMAREYQLKVTALLLKPWSDAIKGNFKFSRLFLDEEEIVWINKGDWSQVTVLAEQYNAGLKELGFVLDEGGSVIESLPGALSLAKDILQNEKELGFSFQHIFVDAGTGFTAAALIKGLSELGHQATVHVLLLADREAVFETKLRHWVGEGCFNVRCFYPHTAKAFGALNQRIKNEIKVLAKEEGILADPVYSAKLFCEARRVIVEESMQGKVLILHSGGALTLSGFDL